ncbi:MAG TPA: CAP domain-containing protein [Candidatus Dormibacteraeota bacterium]|nr:CAP domain-containing protein [Candidatus Dormibacteraeota bacterium]
MTAHLSIADPDGWDALAASAAAVRAGDDEPATPPRTWRRLVISSVYTAVLAGVVIVALHAVGSATPVRADGGADSALFSYTNQDRASNGVRALSWNGTLSTIGEGGRYGGCGFTVYGRAVDMINRDYFAHQILNCGQLVFSIMQAYGVPYRSAGENIGWNGAGAASINSAFMNSPEHRSNILNGNYTSLGVGSDNSGSRAFMGYTNVWMFAEEFAQLGSSAPPPPPPPPQRQSPPRNAPAPATQHLPPAVAAARPKAAPVPTAIPVPTATPVPTPTPTPEPSPSLTLPPAPDTNGGLLFDSVESVLENYLIS